MVQWFAILAFAAAVDFGWVQQAGGSLTNEGGKVVAVDLRSSWVTDSDMPRLAQMPGFGSYCLIESGEGAVTSVSVFETSAQAEESTRVAAKWLQDEKFDAALPNAPKVSAGKVLAGTASAPVLA